MLSSSLVSTFPAAPTKGLPTRSSFSPGPSPHRHDPGGRRSDPRDGLGAAGVERACGADQDVLVNDGQGIRRATLHRSRLYGRSVPRYSGEVGLGGPALRDATLAEIPSRRSAESRHSRARPPRGPAWASVAPTGDRRRTASPLPGAAPAPGRSARGPRPAAAPGWAPADRLGKLNSPLTPSPQRPSEVAWARYTSVEHRHRLIAGGTAARG